MGSGLASASDLSALPHSGTTMDSCGRGNRILFPLQELDIGGPGGRKKFYDAVGRLIEAGGISLVHQVLLSCFLSLINSFVFHKL